MLIRLELYFHAFEKAKISHAAVAFVCLIIKLTVICFCWCFDGGTKKRGKRVLVCLSEIVYSYFISASDIWLSPYSLNGETANGITKPKRSTKKRDRIISSPSDYRA